MSGQKQDYLLRQVDLFRQFVRRVLGKDPDRDLDEALLQALHLQEKLFPLPPAEFLGLDLDAQMARLRQGETRETGNAKCRTYAELLAETASLYAHRGATEHANGARQMGLYAAVSVVLDDPADDAAIALARELLGQIDLTALHPPVKMLLDRLEEAAPADY